MFKDQVTEFNRTHTNKIPERPQNRAGYDYFQNPIAQNITKKLYYELKDISGAKLRLQDMILENLDNERNKCEIKLEQVRDNVASQEGRVGTIKATNKYQQTSINYAELARMGIKLEKKETRKKIEKKKAEQERKEEEFSEFIQQIKKELNHDSSFDLNYTTSAQLEQKKRAKIKANKEVYCVCVDYHEEL